MSVPKRNLLARSRRRLRRFIRVDVPCLPVTNVQKRERGVVLVDGFLGTGFGDRFKVLQGASGLFGEEVVRAEELAVLQGKRTSKRCSLAV